VKTRRVGCLLFGLVWAGIFLLTIVGLALGDPAPIDCTGIPNCDPYPKRWQDYLPLIEAGVLVLGALLFYRAEMKDSDL
jgi:hypothetical protein